MDTTEMTGSGIPSDHMAELQAAAARAAKGVRDPETMRQACERMDRIGEQIRQRHGVLDIGTPAIRELREGE
jgi:hypothetical protein